VARPLNLASSRFRVAYLVLALLLGISIGALAVLLGRPADPERPWSTFRPEGSGLAAAAQIADNVAGRYHLSSGSQLVGVLAQQPRIGDDEPVSAIAVTSGQPDQPSEDIEVFRTNDTLLYILCGIGGQACSIPEGVATTERATLLQREALELALYTFKYVGDTKAVLAILPPPAGKQPPAAAYFRRSDYSEALRLPLEDTLRPAERLTPDMVTRRDEREIRSLTSPNPVLERFSGLYQYQFQQAPDGTALVALAPL
jgi:hypothetical protein